MVRKTRNEHHHEQQYPQPNTATMASPYANIDDAQIKALTAALGDITEFLKAERKPAAGSPFSSTTTTSSGSQSTSWVPPCAFPRGTAPVAVSVAPRLSEARELKPEDFTKPFTDFLTENPTIFHAVDYFKRKLNDAGFEEVCTHSPGALLPARLSSWDDFN